LDRLRKLRETVLTLVRDIEALRRTPLVCELRIRKRFHNRDLLCSLIVPASESFEGLLNLETTAQTVLGNPKKSRRAEYDSCLKGLYGTVYIHTKRWCDGLVADILNELPDRKQLTTEGSLRNWRKKHGLTTTPNTRKK